MKVVLLHGWRVRDPRKTTGRLAPHFAAHGYDIALRDYGYHLLALDTRQASRKEALKISGGTAVNLADGDLVVGHSNGAAIALELSHHTTKKIDLVLINAAADRDMVPGSSTGRCLVIHSGRDWAVLFGGLIPGSRWGRMGRDGYTPDNGELSDSRMLNLSMQDVPWVRHAGHSGFAKQAQRWADFMARWHLQRLEPEEEALVQPPGAP